MASQINLEVSELDFDNIKSNLKTFLQNQSEFQDYDFEGSGFASFARRTCLQYSLPRFQCEYVGK